MGTDLVALVAVICIFGIPMMGLVARFALRPLVQDITRAIRTGDEDEVRELRRRIAELEQRLEAQEQETERLAEAERFHRELRAGDEPDG